MAEQKITTQQRMLNFSALTRQNVHMLPKQTTNTEFSMLQFTYPKARLLAQTYIKFDVEYKLKHASGTAFKFDDVYSPMNICRKITQDLNNGFMPAVMSGRELAMYNTIATHPDKMIGADGLRPIGEQKSSSAGTVNKYSFTLEIKNTLNDSMLQGLVLLQNNSTQVTLNVDIGSITDILEAKSGYSADLVSVSVTPCIVTYTVPSHADAFPDISVLKLMQSKTTTFTSGGDNIVYLDTGTIYRKLAFYVTDEAGNAITADEINGNIELAFNTADIPYSVSAGMLRMMNADRMGRQLPEGLFVFDFSSQSPLIGYGGTRDYVDTEKLTQFTLKLNTGKPVKVTTITEQLSRLI